MTGIAQPDAETAAELSDVEERRRRALIEVDVDALDDLYDDSLVHVHAPGLVHTKAQLMEHITARRAYLDMWRGEMDTRVAGDVAIVVGRLTNRMRAPDGGERVLSGIVTQVLRRCEDGAWRYVSFQMTPDGEQVWGDLPSEREGHDAREADGGESR